MDEQTQQKFIKWLGEQLGVSSEEELQSALQEMGEEGITKAFEAFQQIEVKKKGGKLAYLKYLKQGGRV